MLRKLALLLLAVTALFVTACSNQTEVKENKNIVLYSQLEQDFTEALLTAYTEKNLGFNVTPIYELKPDSPQPDLILAERSTLLDMQKKGSLQAFKVKADDKLHAKFKDDGGYWYGMFYDPAVVLINQQYARTVGQERLRGWFDLENLPNARIVLENVSNSKSSTNFLCALSSNLGEKVALDYLWNLNQNINQYAKFPFTPIRMTAVGDADIAITRQSYVAKYLENNFPAYVIMPNEGTPINLYGAAISKDNRNPRKAIEFIEWLIDSQDAKIISQSIDTGFNFIVCQDKKAASLAPEQMWLNTNYIQKAQQEALVSHWVENVRFSVKN